MLIGDFARLGQVSVRMLRHYDEIGLLAPASSDPQSGYRSYAPSQLSTLNRIVALKDLGLRLEQVGLILADQVDIAELRGMLRLRRTELTEEARGAGIRLLAVESRLRMIEQENEVSSDYVVKPIPAIRLAAVTDTMSASDMGKKIGPMFDRAASVLSEAKASLSTPIATYAETESGTDVVVGYTYDGAPLPGLEIVEMPSTKAVCGVHLGPMDRIQESWQAMHRWLVENNYEYAGPCRELYVTSDSDDQHDWVTELQQPVK